MHEALIDIKFTKDSVSSYHLLKIKIELQKAVRNLKKDGIDIPNPNLICCEGSLEHGKNK